MKKTIISLMSCLLLLPLSSTPLHATQKKPLITAESFLKRIKKDGAQRAISWAFERNETAPALDVTMNGISSANREWLKVAREIMPYTDGAVSEDLFISLGRALEKNPELVFEVVDNLAKEPFLQSACEATPYEEESIPKVLTMLKKRQTALKAIASPKHQKVKLQCLQYVNNALKETK